MRALSDAALLHLRAVADAPDLTGTKYEIGDTIGRGGMGTVYRATDRELGREVALKVLTVEATDGSVAARMLQEARILAGLEHPGIVPVHDVGSLPDGRVFYAMKLVRGGRLGSRAAQLGSPTDRLRIFQQLLDAVAFAHAHGVVHRDLTPQNVMIGEFGEVLVLDWGVAKILNARPSGREPHMENWIPDDLAASGRTIPTATAHGTVIGTDGYMAPEQARGDVDAIDERTDIYALGAILRLLMTEGREDAVPRPMQAIWTKAMAQDAAARYRRVGELADDVSRFLEDQPVTAYPEGFFDRAGRLARKYQTAILLVAAYLIMRIVLMAVAGV